MKKFRYILSALTLLVACATAHAQVFDVTITPSDGSAVFSMTNATRIEINPGADSPVNVFSGDSDYEGKSLTVKHTVHYDFALTPVNSINPGSGDLPEGDFSAQAPRRKAVEEPSFTEPALTGPALVLMREKDDPIIYYATDATEGPITLKCNANGEYVVGAIKVQGVTNVFYKDAHTSTAHPAVAPTSEADGNIAYWSCAADKCGKYFADQYCTEEVTENSWVTTMVAGTISWDDSEDADSKRPESVTINLFAGGENPIKEQTVKASDNWKYSFDLPKYNGESVITYSISENNIDDYTTAVEGYNITNTHFHTHADTDNNGYCDKEKCKAEMNVTVTLSKVGDRYYTSFGATYIYNVTNAGDDLKVYVATELSDGVLTMMQVGTDAITNDMGVVIVGTSSSSPETMTATIAHAEKAEVESELRVTEAGMETTGKAFFSAVDGIVGFYAYNTTLGAVPAGKAYLKLPTEEAGAKRFTMVFDDETTSINNEQLIINNVAGAVYNLQGQRLSAPQKGVNIVNGKKVMVK